MKIATGGRWLWPRTIGSTLVGQGLDSAVFITLAFAGTIPVGALTGAVVTQWLPNPPMRRRHPFHLPGQFCLKRKEGVDIYDDDTKFNPLLISE